MIPTLTKPTMSTVVTPELWIRAVVAAPIPTLTSRLSAVFSNRSLIFPVASCSILAVRRCTPTKNTPVPASSLTVNMINSPKVIFVPSICLPEALCVRIRGSALSSFVYLQCFSGIA